MLWTRLLPSSQLFFFLGPHSPRNQCFVTQQYSQRPRQLTGFVAASPSFQPRTQLHNNSVHPQNIECTTNKNNNTNKMSAHEKIYADLAKSLLNEIVDKSNPSPERAIDILTTLQNESNNKQKCVTIAILENTKIGKILTKTVKACKRHRRTSDSRDEWNTAIATAEGLLTSFKEAADKESKQKKSAASQKKSVDDTKASSSSNVAGLPSSISAYKTRLVTQKKEMHKDPPALPPQHIIIEESLVGEPKRNKATGELTFSCGEDDTIKPLLKDFHPNRSPEEVLRAGSFGGTYFRPITSAVTNIKYNSASVLKDTVQPSWISNLDKPSMLTSSTYHNSINKFKVKCGGSLGMWESSGWISNSDPYGWFQWYCRFYTGRRCSDDKRQISRWCKSAGLKGRFKSQICNKIIAAGTTAGDEKISPVIRQTLLHWGLEVTEDVLEKHRRRR